MLSMVPENRHRWRTSAVALWATVAVVAVAQGDILHLNSGDKIEGEVLKDLGEAYRVRTLHGIVDIPKERVVKYEKGPSPWFLYKEKRRKCEDTAEGHYRLARWCRKHGLRAEETEHLERVVKLDPDHAKARRALGYVQENGGWIKPRSPKAPTKEELEARRIAREEERLLRKLISEWFVKIKAIHRGRMANQKGGMKSEKFRQAREQILAIQDPLALPGLTGVLSAGNVAARRVLIEALARFDEDEATMNLTVMTLLDPSAEIRELAAVELRRRKDGRVVEHLRLALRNDEEHTLRNAAVALGILKAREAVEDLISVLSTETRGTVRVSRPAYLDDVLVGFGGGCRYTHGRRLFYYRPMMIGVLGPNTMVGTATWYEDRPVSIHRTEVQEALIAITGQNFGFDAGAWLQWWRQQGG
ncbi:MAG: HEAT repeat domain-containing protein [Phycisphaerae bacterium]|nr:HEAT repeat domain-containing protein [Phycisphaerae bacterium]